MKTKEKDTKIQKEQYQEYRLMLDILNEYEDRQHKLKKTINALKNNPSYRALHGKDYFERKEKEKKKIDIIIKALNCLRWDEK